MHGDDKISNDLKPYPSVTFPPPLAPRESFSAGKPLFAPSSTMTFRPPVVAAIAAIALSTLAAFIVQLGLLGALGVGNINTDLTLDAAANSRAATVGDTTGLRFDPSRGAAVAQAKSLRFAASDALAVIINTEDVTTNLRLTLGWLSTQDIRRPVTASAQLNANVDPQQNILLLAGHPRWRDNVTQVALALENAAPSNVPPGAFVARTELLPANPIGAARLLASAWFDRGGNIITPAESAYRLLPLALWLALICASSVLAVALLFRRKPEQRAEALRVCATVLAVAAILLTVLANRWPGWTVPLAGGTAAAFALLLLDRTVALPLSASQRTALAMLMAGVSVLLTPLVAAVALVPGAMLLLAQWQRAPQAQLDRWLRAAGLVALLPVLVLAAVAQGLIPAPSVLSPLTDPTKTLALVATSAGGLPGLALGMLAMHQLWPAPAQSRRWSSGAVAALVWALTGAVAVLAIPKLAVLAAGGSTFIALFLPALACLALAVLPKLQTVARSVDETIAVNAKSEADLSAQALTLLESHAERVMATLSRREIGAARSALVQMERIAPAAHATALARLRIALVEGDLTSADAAATQLENSGTLSTVDHDALLELAHRTHLQPRVIELAPGASRTEGNVRALAIAQLLTHGPTLALHTLATWSNERTFAREIAELHLLNDDLMATQQALVNSGIAMIDPSGQAYIARLGMRAQGPDAHAKSINSIATWHPQLAAAQAAQGELLLRQGNASGARARFLLAMKLDGAMWPLRYQMQRIDAATSPATNATANAAQNSNPAGA